MLFFILGPSSLPFVVAQPDERHTKNRFCVGMAGVTDTKHSASGSNEEE